MNFVLKTKVKEINTNITDSNYATELTKSKIEIQEKYIEDSKNNRDTILSEKTNLISANEEEIFTNKKKETELQQSTDTFLEAMKGEDKVTDNMELRYWIRAFGDSVEVLKPIKLRNEFAKEAKRTLKKYESN